MVQGGGMCRACPEGVECDAVGIEVTSLWVIKGYFRAAPESEVVYPCTLEDSACPGGNQTGDKLCSDGYEGPLCDRSVSVEYSSTASTLTQPVISPHTNI